MNPALRVTDLVKRFPGSRRGGFVHAVNGVSLHVESGETLALVGESGSGKSTIGRVALRLDTPTLGRIEVAGSDITDAPMATLRRLRATMQMVFQDPWGTLNPRLAVGRAIEEPLLLHGEDTPTARRARVRDVAGRVRLDPAWLDRYPSQLSGGQLQRVAIARALVTRPALVVLDEPTSSLDLSVRAEILDLLGELKREFGAAYLFITHDLGTVRVLADRVVVLYLGQVMEEGPTAAIFAAPRHPYTRALFSAELSTFPDARRVRLTLTGEPPSALAPPRGCPFAGRCPHVMDACRSARPPLIREGDRAVACLRADEIAPPPEPTA